MRKQDYGMVGLLTAYAVFIWFTDRGWLSAAGDTLPILAGLPLFVWLRRPWQLSDGLCRPAMGGLILAASLFAIGILFNSGLLLTVSWLALLWSWISRRFKDPDPSATIRLLALPLFSFPWITTDFPRIGWWFRLSGAAAAESILSAGRFDVSRHGTYLSIDGLSLSVAAACSGINGLEALLIAGTALAWVKLKSARAFWWNLPVLIVAAWVTNVIRLTLTALCGAALAKESVPEWLGPIHLFAGWLALCAMFGICWCLFNLEQRLVAETHFCLRNQFTQKPWLELILVAYCGWRGAELVTAWFRSPFDQLGWLAFLIWLMPVAVSSLTPAPVPRRREAQKPWLMGIGLALTFLGDLGDLNFGRQAGLAFVLVGLASHHRSLAWGASAVAWLPAWGWVGSRLGLDPATVAPLRILVATAGSLWSLRPRRLKEDLIHDALRSHLSP